MTFSNNPVYRVKIVVENGLGNCLKQLRHNWLRKLKLYKGYINVLLYEIMYHSKMIMKTCVMKAKDNTRTILLYEKVQLNVYKRLFDNKYLLSIHDISGYSCLIPERVLRNIIKLIVCL